MPGGFYQDEAPEELGTRLNLPPWYESQRADIMAMLEPVTVPEENRPRRGTRPFASPTPVAAGASSAYSLSRTKPDFARYQR